MNKLLPCILQITLLLVALFGYSTTYAQKNQWLEAEIQSFETQIASSTNRHQLIYTISNNPEFSLHEKIVVLDSIVQLMPIRQDLNSLELVSQIGDSLCTEAMKGAQGGEEKAFTLSKSAQFNFMLGMIQYQKTDFNAANSFIDKSLSLSNQLTHPNKKLVANCYNVQAIIKCEQGRYDEGIKLFYQSEKILEELGNSNEVANTRMNIALTFRTLGEYDKAISECNRAIAILNKNNSRGQTLGKLYNNLGGIYTDKKEYDQAKEHLERALEIQQEGADSNAIASVYSNYGNLYLKMGDTAMQLDYHKSAYAIYNSLGIQSGKATVGLKIAEVLFAKEPGSNEAYRLATEAMEIGTQNKIADVIQEAADLLHVYHARKQDYEKAYGFLELSGKYKDSILSDQNRNELFRQQNKYAYEKQKALDQAQLQANMDEEKRKRQLLYILIVFSILLIAFMSFAFIRKKRDNAKLKELNDKLNTSEHALLKLNASKDKFFAIISHDLRNPLAAFKNIAKQLLNSKGNLDNEQLADYISDIKVSADQLSELTENLLHWAQSQADLIEMKEAEIDLGIVASKFLLTNDTEAKQAGIDLSSEIPENLYVRADLNMLNTVFRNIIGNALKFTPAGGKVSISAEENEAELVVRISDTGIGIAEKDVEKMFHIEKDHKTIGNSKNKGSGLGLILCKEFVDRNGGRIWVESELGKGTTFYFTLKKAKS